MHKLSLSPQWPLWLRIFLAYLLFLAVLGYQFGSGDQVELLPYAMHMIDPALFRQDFFLSHLSAEAVNERWLFAWILHLCGNVEALPYWCFLLHALSSIALISAWFAICRHFSFSLNASLGLVLLSFLLLYGINLGGNELYYNYCVASLSAKAICSWALLCWLRKRYLPSALLLAVSTYLQPIPGLQLWLIFSGIALWQVFLKKEKPKAFMWLICGFLILAGFWLYKLFAGFQQGSLDDAAFLEIIRFRLPHHFLPAYYPWRAWLILVPLFLFSTIIWYRRERRLFLFFVLALGGCLVYTFFVEVLGSTSLLASQWFKITIWLKPLSILAVALAIRDRVPVLPFLRRPRIAWLACILLALACLRPLRSTYAQSEDQDAVSMALQAQEKTAPDALFAIPASNSSFKYYSRRGTYIDYKSVLHKKKLLPRWYRRIQEVYGIKLENAGPAFGNVLQADRHFSDLSDQDLDRFKSLGIDYVLCFRQAKKLAHPVLASNRHYVIYVL